MERLGGMEIGKIWYGRERRERGKGRGESEGRGRGREGKGDICINYVYQLPIMIPSSHSQLILR